MKRFLAEIFYFLKKKALSKNQIKFLVFTGTVGKTTTRHAVAYALKKAGFEVESGPWGYTNEAGIILSIFGIYNFSFWSLSSWRSFLKARISSEKFVCIELGADFRKDIDWFLKKFRPFAVFINGLSQEEWSRDIQEVLIDKQKILESVPENGFIFFNADDYLIKSLVKKSKIVSSLESISLKEKQASIHLLEWSNLLKTIPVEKILKYREKILLNVRGKKIKFYFPYPLFEPQIYALASGIGFIDIVLKKNTLGQNLEDLFKDYVFPPQRLKICYARNGALIIEDSYKSTPHCLNYCLEMVKKIKARKKIIVLTEMHPLRMNIKKIYSKIGESLNFAYKVYFLGRNSIFHCLRNNMAKVEKIENSGFENLAREIFSISSRKDVILLKGAARYQLSKLKNLLI